MAVLRTALATRGLRSLLLAFVASSLGFWAFTILFSLYAYAEAGATAVGLSVLARMLPAALATPSLAVLADRHSRRLVLVLTTAVQAAALVIVAVEIARGAPFGVVLAFGALYTVAGGAYKPAQAALIPQLARTPAEVAAANVAWGAVDNAGFLAGSLMAALLVTGVGLSTAVAVCALPYVGACALLLGLPRDTRPEPLDDGTEPGGLAEVSAGLRTIRRHPEMRLLTGVFTADMFVQGAVDVLVVIAALELLGLGQSGAGWLNTAWGVGGIAGGFVGLALLGRGRLASGVWIGCVLAGVPLVVLGVWDATAPALALLAILGIGYAVLESALMTLTQRLAPDDVLARVFGVQETLFVLGSALGGLSASLMVAAFGVSGALIATGIALPLLAVFLRARLRRLEAGAPVPERAYALLRALPIFAPLPIAIIENLARRAESEECAVGTDLITQGDPGDRFYVIDEGEAEIFIDGRLIVERAAGDCFGEIALLWDKPRIATVRAKTPLRVIALERSEFMAGIAAHARSTSAAERLAAERSVVPEPAPS